VHFQDTTFIVRKVRRSRVHEAMVEKRVPIPEKPQEPSPQI
jgi:hypothetical protein